MRSSQTSFLLLAAVPLSVLAYGSEDFIDLAIRDIDLDLEAREADWDIDDIFARDADPKQLVPWTGAKGKVYNSVSSWLPSWGGSTTQTVVDKNGKSTTTKSKGPGLTSFIPKITGGVGKTTTSFSTGVSKQDCDGCVISTTVGGAPVRRDLLDDGALEIAARGLDAVDGVIVDLAARDADVFDFEEREAEAEADAEAKEDLFERDAEAEEELFEREAEAEAEEEDLFERDAEPELFYEMEYEF